MSLRTNADTGSTLKTLREAAGLSQQQLGELTGYSVKTISRWELGHGVPRAAAFDTVRRLLMDNTSRPPLMSQSEFTFIDLFAGIGGLRRGFELAGGQCVFTSEWDKYAQVTYRANYRCDHELVGDIVGYPTAKIPAHDVLLAGFPCQPFSIAGVSKKNALGRPHGFADDTQGTLFFEVANILHDLKPRAFLLENVKNLVSHDKKNTFRTILRVLREELGYHVSFRVLDGQSFVPQHRERIYIVGFREPSGFDLANLVMPEIASAPRLGSILHPEDGSEAPEHPFTDEDGRVADRYYLSEHLWKYLRDYSDKHKAKGNGFGFGLVGPEDVARTLSARYHKDGSEILVKTTRSTPRRLTPRECARLMGFDKPAGSDFQIRVSDTQAYRQFGNSVVVPVVEAIASAMKSHILNSKQPAPKQRKMQAAIRETGEENITTEKISSSPKGIREEAVKKGGKRAKAASPKAGRKLATA